MNVVVLKVNAFTEEKHGGNPAGFVRNPPDNITPSQMKQISKELHVSETAFFSPSNVADFNVRFFTPTIEVDLCGHATIASFYCIGKSMEPLEKQHYILTQNTNAGILPVNIYSDDTGKVKKVMMAQSPMIVKPVSLSFSDVAAALQTNEINIRTDYPLQAVSTGLFTLPIIVSSFSVLEHLKPDFARIESLCNKINIGSFHVIAFDTIESTSLYHARNFAPCYGVNEDPVTGTANGAVCSYLRNIGYHLKDSMVVEQGDIIGRPGRVHVSLQNDSVLVGGKAFIVDERIMSF